MDFRERQAVKNQIASFCTLDSCYYIGVSCVPCFLNMRNAIDAIPSLTSIWFVLDSIHSILEVGENHEKMMNTFWSIPVTSSVLSSLPFFLRSFFSFPYLFWARVPIIFLSFPSVLLMRVTCAKKNHRKTIRLFLIKEYPTLLLDPGLTYKLSVNICWVAFTERFFKKSMTFLFNELMVRLSCFLNDLC